MTAKELDTMVNAMRSNFNKINARIDVSDPIYYLIKGLRAIGRNDLAEELNKLYSEIDEVDTNELVKIGTFR